MSVKVLRKAGLAAGFVLALTAAAPGQAQAPAQPAAASNWELPPTDEERIAQLVAASRILAHYGVLDSFGHVSFRSAKNPKHFFMPRARAAGLVTRDDILEFDENSEPIDLRGREIFSERYIHGEIYRARPDAQAVVHSHSPAVLPFGVTKAPLKALIHTAPFLGTEAAPVFEIREAEGEDNHILVNTVPTGALMAKKLGARAVVLMRSHGMAVVAPSIPEVVLRSIYTQENAKAELEALKLGTPVFMNRFEVRRRERMTRHWEFWVANVEKAAQ